MKKLVAIIMLLLPLASAIDIDPKLLGSNTVTADLEWVINFGERLPSEFTLQAFAFSEEPYQKIESMQCDRCSHETDPFGNKLLKFTFAPSSQSEFLNLNTKVTVNYENGFKDAAPEEGNQFLSESKYIKITDEIRSRASTVAGSGSDFEKLVRISEWVHNSIKYEGVGYKDVILTSEEAYAVRSGKCSEFSHLLISMLRSIGIPAKFVAGFVYTGEEWGPHAWAEVLIDGKWVPVDPTFNEVGLLNAGHIKFAEGIDQNNIKEQIYAKGFGFDISSVSPPTRNIHIDFVTRSNFSPLVDLKLIVSNETVGEGSLEIVKARIKSLKDNLAVPVSLTMPKDVRIASDRDRLFYLKSGEEKEVEWRVIFPTNLDAGFVYNYTAEVTTIGKKSISYITAKKGGNSTLEQVLEIKDLRSVQSPDTIALFIVLKNTGSVAIPSASLSTTFSASEQSRSFSLSPGEQKEFQIVFQKPLGTAAEGVIRITANGKELERPFVINLAQEQEATATPFLSLSYGEMKVDLSVEQSAAVAGGVIVLIALATLLFNKPRKPYAEMEVQAIDTETRP